MLPAPRNNIFPELLTTTSSRLDSASTDGGMFSSWWSSIFIFLLLVILGFGIYFYLAKGAQTTNGESLPIWKYLLSFFNYISIDDTSSDSSSSDDEDNTTLSKSDSDPNPSDTQPSDPQPNDPHATTNADASPSMATTSKLTPAQAAPDPHVADNVQNSALNRALNISKPQELSKQDYVASDSYESTQQNKAGWCYIGSDQGFRSCSQVGEADTCMSGNIFPTQDICVNPSLRT